MLLQHDMRIFFGCFFSRGFSIKKDNDDNDHDDHDDDHDNHDNQDDDHEEEGVETVWVFLVPRVFHQKG